MAALADCNSNLVVMIETTNREWSWVYDIVNSNDIQMTNSPSSHPIPYGTTVTDHINREEDVITITGVIGCLSCNGVKYENYGNVVRGLKELKERMTYSVDDFATLTSNEWIARYMILTSVNVRESQQPRQMKQITTTWKAANLTGTIRNPEFILGGIQYL